MSNTKDSIQRYRPSLSADQITHIINRIKCIGLISDADISVLATLAPFEAKIKMLGITPAYSVLSESEKLERTIQGKLGLIDKTVDLSASNLSMLEQRLEAYDKWLGNPAECSISELQAAMLYRYENDLMTPDEESQYEKENM